MLDSLDNFPTEPTTSVEDYIENVSMIEAATESVLGKKVDLKQYPDYYDEMLMKLIDSVPLE